MKKTVFDEGRLNEVFGFYDIRALAENVIARFDNNCEDVTEELINCINDELIYTEDLWTLIEFYSNPDHPDDSSSACEKLFDDLMSCIKEI